MKTATIVVLNIILNALVAFYIFASAFNGEISFAKIVVILFCTGIVLGTISGLIMKTYQFANMALAILPLLLMGFLFVSGGLEKHANAKDVFLAVLILVLPPIFEWSSWIFGAYVSRHFKK